MAIPRRTHYDELGLPRNASAAEIDRAYRKYRTEADGEMAAPDRAREARVRAAYETLAVVDKRAAYDAMLATPERRRRSRGLAAAAMGVAALAAAALGAHLLQPPPPPPPGTLSVEAIAKNASLAIGRLDSVDLSGQAARIGLAFAIDAGVLATACQAVRPATQLSLFYAARNVPVSVAQVDEARGVCKLAAPGVGSWPLAAAGSDPAPGDTVYATKMNAVGEVGLVEAKVKRVVPSARGTVVETSIAVLPDRLGGPVLDTRGRVVGVALLPQPGGRGEIVRITPDWTVRPTQQ